ncbi:MAG: MBL fold metallo-hydrolase [Candidatus Hydrogenedentes bacterium]|nr:MBL fold metallo-hydrolase [Candidatus Hydrogenedentota bacterium]
MSNLPIPLAIPTPFIVGPVNVFLLPDEPVTLVDTGTRTPESLAALEQGLREHGLAVSDIERIFITHHHSDHVGLLSQLMEGSGAEAYGHPGAVRHAQLGQSHDAAHLQFYLDIMTEFGVPEEKRVASMRLWERFKDFTAPFTLTHTFTDGAMAGPFRTHFVPGHSATDTLLVNETAGYTIVGDHILRAFNPNPLLRRPGPGQLRAKSLVEFQDSLRHSRALPLGRCYPGHGTPFEDHRAVIDALLAQHERKNRRVLKLVGEAGVTPFAVAEALYPDIEMQHFYLALSVAVGHLELLETRGVLRSRVEDGVARYYPATSCELRVSS